MPPIDNVATALRDFIARVRFILWHFCGVMDFMASITHDAKTRKFRKVIEAASFIPRSICFFFRSSSMWQQLGGRMFVGNYGMLVWLSANLIYDPCCPDPIHTILCRRGVTTPGLLLCFKSST